MRKEVIGGILLLVLSVVLVVSMGVPTGYALWGSKQSSESKILQPTLSSKPIRMSCATTLESTFYDPAENPYNQIRTTTTNVTGNSVCASEWAFSDSPRQYPHYCVSARMVALKDAQSYAGLQFYKPGELPYDIDCRLGLIEDHVFRMPVNYNKPTIGTFSVTCCSFI